MSTKNKTTPEIETIPSNSRSELSNKIEKLKIAINKSTTEREQLPQPLFWSLFNSKITEIRENKEELRRIEQLLSNLD